LSQLIDLEAAKEFMKETLEKVDRKDLMVMATDLENKSELFQDKLAQDKIKLMTKEDLMEIFRSMFCARRKSELLIDAFSQEDYKSFISELLYSEDDIEARFQNFFDRLGELDNNLKFDLAGELLHFTFPDKYWLWGRWMWDPVTKTGALPLVTTEEFDFESSSMGEMYMKVGKGVAFVHAVAASAGFQFISRSLYGTDVFLTCVYVIYAYTVLRMRMTQEFNKIMPGLTEFSRRILGIYNIPVKAK